MSNLALFVLGGTLLFLTAVLLVVLFLLIKKPNLFKKITMIPNRKCKKCNTKNPHGKFCSHCGQLLGEVAIPLKAVSLILAGVMLAGGCGIIVPTYLSIDTDGLATIDTDGLATIDTAAISSQVASIVEETPDISEPESQPPSSEVSSVEVALPLDLPRYELKWIEEPQYDFELASSSIDPRISGSTHRATMDKDSEFYDTIFVGKNGKFGAVDLNGNIVRQIIDESIGCYTCALRGLEEGRDIVDIGHCYTYYLYIYYDQIKHQFLETYTNVVVPLPSLKYANNIFNIRTIGFVEDYSDIIGKLDTFGLLGPDGNIALKGIYSCIRHIDDKFVSVQKEKGGKWAVYKKDGTIFTDFIYDSVNCPSEGYLAVSVNGKFGYTDENMNTIIPIEYDGLSDIVNGRCYVKEDGLWGIAKLTYNAPSTANTELREKYIAEIASVLDESHFEEDCKILFGELNNDGIMEVMIVGTQFSQVAISDNDEFKYLTTSNIGAASSGGQVMYDPKAHIFAQHTYSSAGTGQGGGTSLVDIYGKEFPYGNFSYGLNFDDPDPYMNDNYIATLNGKEYKGVSFKEVEELEKTKDDNAGGKNNFEGLEETNFKYSFPFDDDILANGMTRISAIFDIMGI